MLRVPPVWGGLRGFLEPCVLKYAPSRKGCQETLAYLTQLFFASSCEGRVFRGAGGVFCGENRSGGEARMGGFAAEFRGFRVAQGCGAAIQRTADMGGLTGRKIF